MKAQQPPQSTTGTSTGESKEVYDEKAAVPSAQQGTLADPSLASAGAQKPLGGEAAPVQPAAQPPPDAPPTTADGRTPTSDAPTNGVLPVDTSAGSREDPSASQSPQLQVQAPTPVAQQQQDEDEMILDRTPEQAARDNDIEMSDSGPSLPLSGQDAQMVVEDEKQAHARTEAVPATQQDLPPAPPLQKTQEQHDGAAASHDTSIVSTPEPTQKWLLPPLRSEFRGRKCLVLDLDETLVHSSFKVCSANFPTSSSTPSG